MDPPGPLSRSASRKGSTASALSLKPDLVKSATTSAVDQQADQAGLSHRLRSSSPTIQVEDPDQNITYTAAGVEGSDAGEQCDPPVPPDPSEHLAPPGPTGTLATPQMAPLAASTGSLHPSVARHPSNATSNSVLSPRPSEHTSHASKPSDHPSQVSKHTMSRKGSRGVSEHSRMSKQHSQRSQHSEQASEHPSRVSKQPSLISEQP
eukprot:Sspe_Gene.82083::Locus_53652_Transcript_1_1_Confidence_1.000_Length_714::g.82083::m.82083